MSKERIDLILLNKGLFESREKAKASIMAGIVFVNGERVEKPGTMFPPDCDIEIKGNLIPYVSRGGLKLAKAIEEFEINLTDLVCVDVGASTGGFTDVMLKNGARKVFSVDVGYGQLAWELRKDPRVICMERTNFRYVTDEHIPEPLDFGAVDVAFISLKLILPPLKKLLKPHGKVVCLIKPQFEAGKDKVGKKGVVKDPEVHREVIENIIKIATELGFSVLDLSYSPITGPEGNIEYLLYLNNNESDQLSNLHELIFNTVENSHKNLS
ncbi:MAG: TlyA family RNA methyltransferase [Acetivibrionales bacterium]|jgi:23S rRNA (cytidine1920-2'-O)/16S rRNA (cytidine1409-2'-O)-methyltransferase|nr:TlyA family RNA methyltransferase [Clostridiaceae bacterium]